MCHCGDQFLTAQRRDTCLYLRTLERWIQHRASLSASATDEHCAHASRSIARHTTPALGSLVVRMRMNREQTPRTRTWLTIDAERVGLRSIGEVATGHRRLIQ